MTPPVPPNPLGVGLDVVAFVDPLGTFSHLSESVAPALGYSPAELAGSAAAALIHPDDRKRVAGAFSGASDGAVACRCRHKDGSWRQFRVSAERLPPGAGAAGKPERLLVTAQDLTGRGRHDERLRLLESVATHANDAILITEAEPTVSPGPRILYANPAFLRTTGYTLDEVLGKTPRILQGPETDPVPLAKIRAALQRWRPVVVEVLNYRKDGTHFWVELSIVPVSDSTGWYTHWVSIQHDITERKRTIEDLRAAKNEAQRANRAKTEFMSRMSHELRTPLNGILGFAQILQMDPAAAPHRAIVDDLYDAGRRLLGLINEVLDISSVEAGGLPLAVGPVPLSEVVREGLSVVAPLAAGREIRLEADFPSSPPVFVAADRQRLGQVVLNLLANAVKYNAHGGSVTVASSLDGGRARVRVTDTGPGIPPEKMGRLFTAFDRLGAEATAVEGTGLGLALSRRLVEAMGGTMGAESEVGKGSSFWFELPLAEATSRKFPDPPQSEAYRPPGGEHLVLYIEDNPANVRVIELALAHRPGVRFLAAACGEEGVELAGRERPDLILLDLHLPDISGEEVLNRLRADPVTAEIPVVVLTADAMSGRVARLREAGAADYLTKPLNIRGFLRVVDLALRLGSAAVGYPSARVVGVAQ